MGERKDITCKTPAELKAVHTPTRSISEQPGISKELGEVPQTEIYTEIKYMLSRTLRRKKENYHNISKFNLPPQ